MPDRDDFNVLHPRHRPAAKELVRAARGEEADPLSIAESLNLLFKGGVPSLGSTLRLVGSQGALFQGPDFKRHQHWELRGLHEQHGFHHAHDRRLLREAVRACAGGVPDAHQLVRQFVFGTIKGELIEAKQGVRDQLLRQGTPLDMACLEKALSPLLDTAAALMLRRPNFKRLGLASRSWSAVDLNHENLLGGPA